MFARSRPFPQCSGDTVGIGGATDLGTYAIGWLALRERLVIGCPFALIIVGIAPLLFLYSPAPLLSYTDFSFVELNWLRSGGRARGPPAAFPKLESDA